MHSLEQNGYVISPQGAKWLWQYRSQMQYAKHFHEGKPVEFGRIGLRHEAVPMELRARFAVWAYTMVEAARRKRSDAIEYERAMRQADAYGRFLAVLLRAEIGSGTVILVEDTYRDPCGGPYVWQVTDDADLLPYWHRPSAGYVIDHEELGEWAWQYHPAHRYAIGTEVGCDDEWHGEHAIPRQLVTAFAAWHNEWSRAVNNGDPSEFDWGGHNEAGIALSRELKQAVGPLHSVIYYRPYEEPEPNKLWHALELRMDGSVRPFKHKPYWACLDPADLERE